MARSPLTLAASITSALPQVDVVGVGALTENASGRYDSAVAELDDGRRVVVRVPTDEAVAAESVAQARALRALTPGVRRLLPFRAPELLGETGIAGAHALVVDFLPGYRVDAGHLPPGRGAATSLGEALAALHALPVSVVRAEGLPARTPDQVRSDVARLIDRAVSTRRLPAPLEDRWRAAVLADELWRFESCVVLGGAVAASFLFEDLDGVPTVTGLLEWHGLSVGDPAVDLQWLASAPGAADDVYASYVARSGRAPHSPTRERSRLYAELEFAKWLVHGHDSGREDIVGDAVELLESLAAGVAGERIVADAALDVDDAIALLDRLPGAAPPVIDTSMQTDAYDPEELSRWLSDTAEDDDEGEGDGAEEHASVARGTSPHAHDDLSTAPVTLPTRAPAGVAPEPSATDAAADAQRASEAALKRWLSD